MKKQHKIYLLFSLLFTFTLFLCGIAVRYVIDPVGVNNKFDLGLYKDVALAYRTQKFVELNEVKPNTLMLGGSRVHYLQPNDVQKYTNDKVYNMGLSYATLEEQYFFLKYSTENFEIKNVVMGLNLYPFSEKLEENTNSDFNKNLFKYGFNFYYQIKHYLEIPLFKYLKYAYTNTFTEPFYKDGAITPYHQSVVLNSGTWEERQANSYNGYVEKYKNYLEWGESNLEYFKKIVQLCQEKNINLKVFTTAVHVSQLHILEDLDKMDIYYQWKKELAKIVAYWDFMYENSVTQNDDNFIDTSHIKQELGYLYFAKLFEDNEVEIPEDFGIYMSEENINL